MGKLLPHEGESKTPFFGSKGSMIPFNPKLTVSSPKPSDSSDQSPDPMQPAMDQIERALAAKADGVMAERQSSTPSASPGSSVLKNKS